ncbi:unnamed protein product [Didymodactylos carnosus]|uniref:Golgin-84 n=2 Tax=Didymodactylos carnosus TaxID=1234261 RepID=A0A813ZJL6_9BILA|nr:unnamed protein product [Didymodactylos carnosus]CAF3682353.1 unnamed protein product [Didymodactylos carnosus]
MSWILKQAEDILNKVDQQANVAFHLPPQQQSSIPSSENISSKNTSTQAQQEKFTSLSSSSKTSSHNLSTSRQSSKEQVRHPTRKSPSSIDGDAEVDLMQFLNSAEPINKDSNKQSKSNHTKQTNSFSSTSLKHLQEEDNFLTVSKSVNSTPRSLTPAIMTMSENNSEDVRNQTETNINRSSSFSALKSTAVSNYSLLHQERQPDTSSIPDEMTQEKLISAHDVSLELSVSQQQDASSNDNHLKDELIQSLNDEMFSLKATKQSYESELQNSKRLQLQYQQQISECDALLRDLRTKESDYLEALSTKDSQIALLRIRLQESDDLCKQKQQLIDQLQQECVQTQAFDSLQLKISQLEFELSTRQFDMDKLQNDYYDVQKQAQDDKQQLLDLLKVNEKKMANEKQHVQDIQQQNKQLKVLIQQLELDMQDYKQKAQRILQTKDTLIAKLKEFSQQKQQHRAGIHDAESILHSDQQQSSDDSNIDLSDNGNLSPIGSSSSQINWSQINYDELKIENDLYKSELKQRELLIYNLKHDLSEYELQQQHYNEQTHAELQQLQDQLQDEKHRYSLLEQDCKKLKTDYHLLQDDLHKQKHQMYTQLTERERDLEKVRLQLTSKTINHLNDNELEKRLQTLTENLIQKQTIIETLQTDKQSLNLQLERLESRLNDYDQISTASSQKRNVTTIQMSSDQREGDEHSNVENIRYRMPLLRESPNDVDLAKKVKRAVSELDKLGIRLGVFLRRYPIVRLGVLFYAILLHAWVLLVLSTYTPETHDTSYQPPFVPKQP